MSNGYSSMAITMGGGRKLGLIPNTRVTGIRTKKMRETKKANKAENPFKDNYVPTDKRGISNERAHSGRANCTKEYIRAYLAKNDMDENYVKTLWRRSKQNVSSLETICDLTGLRKPQLKVILDIDEAAVVENNNRGSAISDWITEE